jgi:hypothetical protein
MILESASIMRGIVEIPGGFEYLSKSAGISQ